MTRSELSTRIQQKVRRTDATSVTQILNWINEVVRHIERQKPFQYTKKPQEASLDAKTKSFTLPSTLILHHPFQLLLKDDTNAANPSYTYLVKTRDAVKDIHFPQPEAQADKTLYWSLVGKSNGIGFDIYPVMNAAETLRISGGYFYTGDWDTESGGDSSTNWLSNNHPWLIIEGASALCFEHYGETEKADRSSSLFSDLLDKAMMEQDEMEETGRVRKAKLLSDKPVGTASKIRQYGY